MCIYCNTTNYRKIYENHYGPIPKEEDGRTYEIHHIDGNHSNNSPNNLKAVTVREHYDIHYAQGDYGACVLIALQRLSLTPQEISEVAKQSYLTRVEKGVHNWTTEYLKEFNRLRVEKGTHPFLGTSINDLMKARGTHPGSFKWTCSICGLEGRGKSNYTRYHEGNCLQHPSNKDKKREPNNFTKDNPNSKFTWLCDKCGLEGRGKFNLKSHSIGKNCEKRQKLKKESGF